MKKVIIFLLLFTLPGISYSADVNKREIVEELLALNNAESMIDNIYLQIVITMKDEMSWDKMKEPVIQAYLTRYSEKEIQDQIAFYKSDPGQSMKTKEAKFMVDTMRLLNQEILKNFISKLQEKSKELVKYASIPYNNAAYMDLANAATAQEGYYIDNRTYSDSLEKLPGNIYGLFISEGVTLRVISADDRGYSMESFHKNGDKKFQIKGPGGAITSEPKENR